MLVKRNNPGDSEAALEYYTRCLNQREKLLATNPDSSQAARDVWFICRRLADLAEKTGQGDAKAWWKRAYDILNGMAQKGMFLSETDKKDLETVRKKAAPSGNDETRMTKPEGMTKPQ